MMRALADLAPREVALAASKIDDGAHPDERAMDLILMVEQLRRDHSVILWQQGRLGELGIAAGAHGYETGIGWHERCDLLSPTSGPRVPTAASRRPSRTRPGCWAACMTASRSAAPPRPPSKRPLHGLRNPVLPLGDAGCPLGNLIPEWNDLVRRGRWDAASDRLHATNNFPEFTGRLCPAPCEAACVLSIADEKTGGSVTIKRIEQTIADQAWMDGVVEPQPAAIATGKRVAVVGSGPAGLAAAQQLTRAGHHVTVHERDDRLGGLMRYGIPEYKLEKATLNQRLAQMRVEGTRFVTECEVGVDLTVEQLREQHDAVVLAVGALRARDNEVEGRHLDGVHLAMEHLVPANRECEGDGPSPLSAKGKHVVIIGGGDTGADCLGTAHRQGAASVTQLDYNPEPPEYRDESRSPRPMWPLVLRTSPAHAEGGARRYEVAVQRFAATTRAVCAPCRSPRCESLATPTAVGTSPRSANHWRFPVSSPCSRSGSTASSRWRCWTGWDWNSTVAGRWRAGRTGRPPRRVCSCAVTPIGWRR